MIQALLSNLNRLTGFSHFRVLQRRKNKTSGTRLLENILFYLYKNRGLIIPEFLIYLCFGCWLIFSN
jgi:hypothetical protein